MQAELQQIEQFFQGYDIPLSKEWLERCIEWCKDGNLPPNYTLLDLKHTVFEQWVCLDLRDVEVASLPRNISNEKKLCLTGIYYLQLMQVVDISKPKHWQLQRIRNNVAKNTEAEKDFGKRVLQLTLTDGVQEIEAMEFQPIPSFNINLLPGTKIRVTGPVMVRNGRLMLKHENVKCLGGAVDEIKVHFAAENVLARALRLEENPNPYTIDENALEVPETNTTTQITRPTNTHNFHQSQNYQSGPRNDLNTGRSYQSYTNTKPQMNTVKTHDKNRDCSSPDLFEEMEIDDDLLNEHLNQIDFDVIASNQRSSNTTRKIDSISNSSINVAPTKAVTDSKNTKLGNTKKKLEEEVIFLEDEDDFFDVPLEDIDSELAKLPCSTQKPGNLRASSPELTSQKSRRNSTVLTLKKSKTVNHSILNFTSSKKEEKNNLFASERGGVDEEDNPFSIFKKNKPKSVTCSVVGTTKNSSVESERLFSSVASPEFTTNRNTTAFRSPDSESKQSSPPSKSAPSRSSLTSPVAKPLSVLTIDKLKKMMPNIGKGKFRIKGKYKSVAEKLQHTNNSFHFIIVVEDSTGDLTVQIDTDVVTKMTGISPEEFGRLRVLALQQDEAVIRQIMEILSNLHKKCLALDDVLEIQVVRGQKHPVVINVV